MMIGLQSIIAQSVYLVILGVLVPMILRRAQWVLRAPRLAIALQLVDELAHRRRLGAAPQPPHDLGLELAKGAGQSRSSVALLLTT